MGKEVAPRWGYRWEARRHPIEGIGDFREMGKASFVFRKSPDAGDAPQSPAPAPPNGPNLSLPLWRGLGPFPFQAGSNQRRMVPVARKR
ncbi:hypothetical protein HNR46_002727 [Haloferula luteola]|uniref:Uncharacterized protein n=1 Tax=Haloferula luteola TaxID=595692 RepID=A0A840VIF0_9BACT|nr:hypothetical protein [Haloferula luteola]